VNKKDNLALVPAASGALEKAEPGRKRILSGMVADTLALSRKESLSKPTFAVLLGLGDETDWLLYDRFEKWFETKLGQEYNVRFVHFDRLTELLRLVHEQTFGLVVVSRTNTIFDSITDLLSGTRELKIVQCLERLISQLRIPIFIPGGFEDDSTERLKRAGIHVWGRFGASFSIRAFWNTLQSCLPHRGDTVENDGDTVSRLRSARPPRFVIMDEREGPPRILPGIYKHYYKDATVLLFDDAEEAINELSREEPDLFTTHYRHPKFGATVVLRFLAERNARFPIFVFSWGQRERVLRDADPDLNVTLFDLMYNGPEILREMEKYFGPADQPDTPVPKDGA